MAENISVDLKKLRLKTRVYRMNHSQGGSIAQGITNIVSEIHRTMKSKLILVFTLFFLMLTTGVFWGTWFTLTRSLSVFSAGEFIHIGQTIIANVAWPMRFLLPGTMLLMLISLWQHRKRRDFFLALGIISFLLLTAVLLVTLIVLVPIDNQIATWTPETVPGNWTSLRSTWDQYHTYRTVMSVMSFFCFTLFAISQSRQA